MAETAQPEDYLQPGYGMDYEHPGVRFFVEDHTNPRDTPLQKAVHLYYAVRDGWRYNPYHISTRKADLRASSVLKKEDGHCLDKGVILTAGLRAVGVPARLCLAKVRNHIAAEKMIAVFGTDELVPHGYVEIWLEERWLKVTPAFNKGLCDLLRVEPLEFDGTGDALFQEFDSEGGVFMEYIEDYGPSKDVPYDKIHGLLRRHYPHIFKEEVTTVDKEMMMRMLEQ